MNGADLRALEVFGEWSKPWPQSHKTPEGSFMRRSLIAYRPAMRLARVAKKNKPGGRARLCPSRALVTMEGGNALNRAYECCRTYHTTSGPRATTGMALYKRALKPAAKP